MSVGPAASPIDVASAQHQLGRLHSNFPDVAGTPASLANCPVTLRAAPSSHSRAHEHEPRLAAPPVAARLTRVPRGIDTFPGTATARHAARSGYDAPAEHTRKRLWP